VGGFGRVRPWSRRSFGRASAASVACAVILLLATCSGDDSSGARRDSGGTPAARPSSTATLAIVSPENGQVLMGGSVPVEVSLEGAEIVPTTSTDLVPDQGHLHVLIDDRLVEMNYALDGVISDVAPGSHVLRVEFVALDHAPFEPRVFAEVVFEVRP
jgi:hypothetical protein